MTAAKKLKKRRERASRNRPLDREYLAAIEPMLSEWATPEDAAAYDGLKPS